MLWVGDGLNGRENPAFFLWSNNCNQTLEKYKSFWTQAKRSLSSCILIYQSKKKKKKKSNKTSGFISSIQYYCLCFDLLTFSPFEVTFIIFLNASLLGFFRNQNHWNPPFLSFPTNPFNGGGVSETLHLKGRKKVR